ncbi:MAG: PQQ-dependent sugar dehydrogenase [Pseudomonadota bacterium]
MLAQSIAFASLLALGSQALAQQSISEEEAQESHTAFQSMLLRIAAMQSSSIRPAQLVTLSEGLDSPWGMAFLPDDRLLVTEKGGVLTILDLRGNKLVASVEGLPPVVTRGQGGLLDIAVDPNFDGDPWVYWSYSEAGTGDAARQSGTAVARGRLQSDRLEDITVIYRQLPKGSSNGHFGSRLAFGLDGTLFVTLGDRRSLSLVQDLATGIGKVVRINRDGSLPADNPEFANGRSALWSLGHRNPQGAAIHPVTGELWLSEHGPQGGDEINRVAGGGNYGWPTISYGCEYGEPVGAACQIGGGVHAPDFLEPISYWVPVSTAPAGISFYTGTQFPEWQESLFVAALAGRSLWRIALSNGQQIGREALFTELDERIRDVSQGPDGALYFLTDSGKLMRYSRSAAPE